MISNEDCIEDVNQTDCHNKYLIELDIVNNSLITLNELIDEYDNNMKIIWDDILVGFSISDDCNILFNFKKIKSKLEFYNIMYTTPYYKQLQISLNNFSKRYNVLQNKLTRC